MADAQKYTQKLKGDRVLVIGGSAGIGFNVAEALIEHGANVTISSSSQSRIDDAVNKLLKDYPSAKGRINGYPCDLANESTLDKNIEQLFENVGELDHVVFTAGDKLAVQPLDQITMDGIKQAGMVRFFAPLFVAKHAKKHLKSSYSSSLTLTSGTVAYHPMAGWTVVGSYASGAHAMTKGLALDLAPVRVNLVSPGAVDTPLWAHMEEGERKRLFEEMGKKTTTGRVGDARDVAEAYLYAMKDWNLSGADVSTNGGGLLK